MKPEEARKLCQLIWEKQNMTPPIELLLIGYSNDNNTHEWIEDEEKMER